MATNRICAKIFSTSAQHCWRLRICACAYSQRQYSYNWREDCYSQVLSAVSPDILFSTSVLLISSSFVAAGLLFPSAVTAVSTHILFSTFVTAIPKCCQSWYSILNVRDCYSQVLSALEALIFYSQRPYCQSQRTQGKLSQRTQVRMGYCMGYCVCVCVSTYARKAISTYARKAISTSSVEIAFLAYVQGLNPESTSS